MKLNIYGKLDNGKKGIVKTYIADTYDLMFGTCEDIANAIKLDDLKTGSNEELVMMAGKLVLNSFGTVKDLLKDVFEGITDEELRGTKAKEIAVVLVDVVKYTIDQLNLSATGAGKN